MKALTNDGGAIVNVNVSVEEHSRAQQPQCETRISARHRDRGASYPQMRTRTIAKAWYLLLAANDSMRARMRREPSFLAVPCETLDDLATQLALHDRFAQHRLQ